MNLAMQRSRLKGATLVLITLIALAAVSGCNRRDPVSDAAPSGGGTVNPPMTQRLPSDGAASAAIPGSPAASMPASAPRP